jgi:hypothetical protein
MTKLSENIMNIIRIILLTLIAAACHSYASTEPAATSSDTSISSSEDGVDLVEMQKTREMVFKYMTLTAGLDFLKGIVELKCFEKKFINGVETRLSTDTESCKVEKQIQREHFGKLLKEENKNLTEEDREILRKYYFEFLI